MYSFGKGICGGMEVESRRSKREAILNSALKIFERDGFYKAKVENIAKEANVGKGTIYEYFDSKKDLFYQMVKSMVDQYIDDIQKIAEEDVDPISKLQNIVRFHLKPNKCDGNLGYVIHVEAIKSGIGEELKLLYMGLRSRQIDLTEKIILEGIESKVFKEINAYMTAIFFIGGVHQFNIELNHVERNDDNEKNIDVERILDIFLNGLAR